MPPRKDIKKIMIVGSGPIVIGQACEFDYSGTQACKALKEEGYEVVLLNSNPATVMTDPDFADRTYIEPITPEVAEQILAREKPDVLLPTLGGQTALNLAVALARNGALARHGVELIGASLEAIEKAEDRQLFKDAMNRVGVDMPRSGYATTFEESRQIAEQIGFPVIIRPSFTMGGEGGGVAYNKGEFDALARRAIDLSPSHTILVEESILGWKEYELEVMRDRNDNVVIVCSIENFDPMGVHTGDSITVAPAQTLSDKEYQHLQLVLLPAEDRLLHEDGVGGREVEGPAGQRVELPLVVGDAAALSTHGEAGADDDREADLLGDGPRLLEVGGVAAAGHVDPDPVHGVLEELPVLRLLDGLERRPDELDPVPGQGAVLGEGHRQVERGLAAQGGQEDVGLLPGQDLLRHLGRDGLDVGPVGEVRVGHHRRRIGVEEDDLVPLLLERLAGLGARVVELAGLADDDRSGPHDHDLLDVQALRHRGRTLT